MSHRDGDEFTIEPEPGAKCALCGKFAELRPYGPSGESICFDCGMANRQSTDAAFRAAIQGVEVVRLRLFTIHD